MIDYKDKLENMYQHTNSHIIEYTNLKSPSAQARNKDYLDRIEKIKVHVESQFNGKGKAVSVSLKQEKASMQNRYCISHTNIKDGGVNLEDYIIYAHGEQESFNYLFSLLHEVGHLIDFNKRGINVAFSRGKKDEIDKEHKAWVYGFKFALTFGYMTREEVENALPDAMLSLATYYKYYRLSFGEYLMGVQEIRKEVLG